MKTAVVLSAASSAIGAAAAGTANSGQPSYALPGARFRAIHLPQPSSLQARSVDAVTSNHVVMRRIPGHGIQPAWQNSFRKEFGDGWDLAEDFNTTKSATSNMTFLYNRNYVVPMMVAGQEFQVSVDTGSSDSWVVQSNFTCVDPSVGIIPPEFCSFGPTFNGSFKYGLVPGVANFSLTYADGTYISGNSGFDDVTLAGMTIKKQQILMTTEASWSGDTITSGLLGLSYPLETRLFNVSTPDQNYVGSPTHRRYDPVFTNMFKQGLVSPSFSMAMNRTAQKGWLAFGGLPPVDHDPNFAKTRIRVVGVDNSPATKTENSYYTIIPDGFIYGRLNTSHFNYSNPNWDGLFNDTNTTQFPVMIDSGATFSYLPREIVLPYVRQFPPPVGRFGGQYWASCNATAPPFGVTMGGKTFYLSSGDILQQDVRQDQLYNGLPVTVCLISFMDSFPNGPFIFGDNFLNNFLSVFDVGNSEMRFYARK